MAGETDLRKLLQQMDPSLHPETIVFCSLSPQEAPRFLSQALGWFEEAEGVTLVVEHSAAAQAGLKTSPAFRQITLNVHSSLSAVGFLAAVTQALAGAGISANTISAYYHDHLFVPEADADRALSVLAELSDQGSKKA